MTWQRDTLYIAYIFFPFSSIKWAIEEGGERKNPSVYVSMHVLKISTPTF